MGTRCCINLLNRLYNRLWREIYKQSHLKLRERGCRNSEQYVMHGGIDVLMNLQSYSPNKEGLGAITNVLGTTGGFNF